MNNIVQKITSDSQEAKETADVFNKRDEDADTDYIAIMRDTMEGWYSRPRSGWHVTDIALCPRQRVFKAIDPLPLTDKELNMYSSGRDALKTHNRRMAAKLRLNVDIQIEKPTTEEQHPPEVKQAVRMGAV